MSAANIIFPQSQFLDANGRLSREWLIWLQNPQVITINFSSAIGIGSGGTGATTAPTALANLGGAAKGVNSDITSLTGLSTPLSIAQGGTGSATAAAARTALGLGSMATQGANAVAITGGTASLSTIAATSTITPSSTAGIVGTALADDADAGSVGEFITATGTAVSLTTATAANVTSIPLTAGDWEVCGNVVFNPAAGATITNVYDSIGTTSATLNADPFKSQLNMPGTANSGAWLMPPTIRINVSVTTTVYLVAMAAFGVSTCTATGFIAARRVR